MANKIAAFLLENNFNGVNFLNLGQCLNNAGVTVAVISTRKDASLTDKEESIRVYPEASYARTNPEQPDLFCVVDENNEEKISKSKSAQKLLRSAEEAGKIIVAMGKAVSVLGDAGIVRGKKFAAPSEMRPKLAKFGAQASRNAIEEDGNVVTSKNSDSIKEICALLINKLGLKAA